MVHLFFQESNMKFAGEFSNKEYEGLLNVLEQMCGEINVEGQYEVHRHSIATMIERMLHNEMSETDNHIANVFNKILLETNSDYILINLN